MTDSQPAEDEFVPSPTVGSTIIGAWEDALGSDWPEKAFLVLLVAFLTIPFLPFWFVLMYLEKTGHYDYEGGFSL